MHNMSNNITLLSQFYAISRYDVYKYNVNFVTDINNESALSASVISDYYICPATKSTVVTSSFLIHSKLISWWIMYALINCYCLNCIAPCLTISAPYVLMLNMISTIMYLIRNKEIVGIYTVYIMYSWKLTYYGLHFLLVQKDQLLLESVGSSQYLLVMDQCLFFEPCQMCINILKCNNFIFMTI